MAGPVHARTIIAGEALTYFLLALVQSALIVTVGSIVFGVSWGNPLAAALLVIMWALVGAGAGLLSGTFFRTPEQASAIGPTAGIALAMLGGCMWPLSIVSATMREIGHITPQAWAVDAWTSLLSRHGPLTTILPQLGVLAAFAAVLLRFHRSGSTNGCGDESSRGGRERRGVARGGSGFRDGARIRLRGRHGGTASQSTEIASRFSTRDVA